jgi:hypothetical protein
MVPRMLEIAAVELAAALEELARAQAIVRAAMDRVHEANRKLAERP